jgi:GDP-L-fucose synthase
MREFLHVDDLADACLFLMCNYSEPDHLNIGTGVDITIRELGETLRDIIHPNAELVFDSSKPDGMPRKVLDVTTLSGLGWKAQIGFQEGVQSTYDWYLGQSPENIRGVKVPVSIE